MVEKRLYFNTHPVWYVIALFLMPLFTALALFIVGNHKKENSNYDIMYLGGQFVYIFFPGGPLQEEFGWRAYALPELQQKFTALKSSIIIGVFWAIWHIPLSFIGGAGIQYQAALSYLLGSVFLMVSLSVIFTWLYNSSTGNMLVILLLHTSLNFSAYIVFPVFEVPMSLLIYMGFIVIFVLTIIFIWGKQTLSASKIKIINE